MENLTVKKKAHRNPHSGRKFVKKKSKNVNNESIEHISAEQRNPKAFAIKSVVRAERRFRRKQDLETKKMHIPLVDRVPIEPPPIIVGVVGPSKVGKTTLIRNLIKSFTKAPFVDIKGPVTIVTGKKRRITLIECNNEINAMIDLAKVADLVLLLCDASFGFEMEIFEFLNICQAHGMPRIMGVLTHLDLIKNNKTLKTKKKVLKHRFWTEVYPGAKLFYLSGICHEEYLRNEIKNLGRFISVMKFRPLNWRTTHSYLLVDRIEDLTNSEKIRNNEKCDRNVCFYGYIRGISLKKNNMVHIAGLGDLPIYDISFLPDPCPLPDELKKRALIEKEKLVYAPFSGVGGIVYDKDAVYVELGGSHTYTNNDNNETCHIVDNIMDAQSTLDGKIVQSGLQIFSGSNILTAHDIDDVNILNDEAIDVITNGKTNSENKNVEHFPDSDEAEDELQSNSDSDFEMSVETDEDPSTNIENVDLKWKSNLLDRAKESFLWRQQHTKNLMKCVYGILNTRQQPTIESNVVEEISESEGLLKTVHERQIDSQGQKSLDCEESSLVQYETSINWLQIENHSLIKDCFVTGQWDESTNAMNLLKLDDAKIAEDDSDGNSEIYGDFDDLENNVRYTAKDSTNVIDEETQSKNTEQLKNEDLIDKKMKLKQQFDAEYDNKDSTEAAYYEELKTAAEYQAQLNKTVFDNVPDETRVQLEGFRPGMYVRIEFENIPAEFINNFDPTYPIVIGGLNVGEENVGFVNVRIKKHRWYGKILKSSDPLILSLGWRRFQTLPIFSKLEDDMKYRYLKYTPEHLSCNAHFWGPLTPQGSGFIALQSVISKANILKNEGFRIAASGTVQEMDKSTVILKKLKLVGYPLKIYTKTAFVKGMFNSSLEVARFEGARIKTVSGIRGQIKKAINQPEGSFRATFEDKIKLSDIVFCRTWYKVDVPQFYVSLTTLLLPHDEKNAWKGIRTTGEIKRVEGIKNETNEDNLYKEIRRTEKPFKPIRVSKKLQAVLPYRYKPKMDVKKSDRQQGLKRVAVIKEPHECEVDNMMKMIKLSYREKCEQQQKEKAERVKKHKTMMQNEELQKRRKWNEKKREVCRKLSQRKKSLANDT